MSPDERVAQLRRAYVLIDNVGLDCQADGHAEGWFACNRLLSRMDEAFKRAAESEPSDD